MKKFNNAFELASWINANIVDELRKEQLMYEGVNTKKVNGSYIIVLKIKDLDHLVTLDNYNSSLNGDMAEQFNESQNEPEEYNGSDLMDYSQ